MNLQRWIALGMLALLGACIATSNLWMSYFQDEDEEGTPTPEGTGTGEPGEGSVADDAESTSEPEVTLTPTLNPIVVEMMEEAGEAGVAVSNEPVVVLAGDFTSIDATHQGTGTASIYRVGDTRLILRLDPFTVTHGPDLHVLLSRHEDPRTSTDALVGSVDLGALASPSAAQNFEVPAGTDLNQYKSVVIYSISFNIVYTTAKLEAVRGS
jgi:hypothetical protein